MCIRCIERQGYSGWNQIYNFDREVMKILQAIDSNRGGGVLQKILYVNVPARL